jgi:carbon-monoxide dehydrogenase medium subunit|nr:MULTISPECIES: xanthine dehydrogenase family protein subunit M [unclassified Iodidimonas]
MMYSFTYQKPDSVTAARSAFEAADDASYLAGGMTMIPTMKQRLAMPSDLVDLSAIPDLKQITMADDHLVLGAMCSHHQVAMAPQVLGSIPALAALAGAIGDQAVRYRGTMGGSVANNDPAADYPGAVLALDATIITDRREIAADDFFTGMFETALDAGELITAIRFKKPRRAAYMKFHHPASRYAIAGVFVAEFSIGVRLAVTGAGPVVHRLDDFEQALQKSFLPEALEPLRVDEAVLNHDHRASAAYRAHLVKLMAQRAVKAAGIAS